MSNEFMREERYIVFKMPDPGNSLKGDEIRRLAREYAEHLEQLVKKPLDYVVIGAGWSEYGPTWKALEARVAGAQPAPSFADAYQGAMEEVAIWKKRALEAEDLNRKFVAEINGPTYMGEPTQPAPSVPADTFEIIRGLVREIERNTCTHEETHRGGFLWEICDSCGAKWADDEGGKPEFKWPEVVEKARDMLEAAPGAQAQPAPIVLDGFSREDLEAVADGLDGYEKTVNVGNVTGGGDNQLESTTAYAARFIRAMLAKALEAKR